MTLADLKDRALEEINRRPGAIIVLAHICNLIDATAKQRYLENADKLERSKECDLEQLKTFRAVVALLEGLIDKKQKEGFYDGIRRGAE